MIEYQQNDWAFFPSQIESQYSCHSSIRRVGVTFIYCDAINNGFNQFKSLTSGKTVIHGEVIECAHCKTGDNKCYKFNTY